MNESSDHREAWVRECLAPQYPELVAPYLEAQQIYDRAKDSGRLDAADTECLLAHARSSRTPLGYNAATMLGELHARIPALGAAIRSLAEGRRAHERVNAVIALHFGPPTELHIELLELLLRDKSARVRALAADKIVGHQLKQLAGALEVAANRVTNPKVAEGLRAELDYLLHRFHVHHLGETVGVTCRPLQGGSITKVFTRQAYETVGRAWIDDELKGSQGET